MIYIFFYLFIHLFYIANLPRDQLIGQGGFAKVYWMSNNKGEKVAVKKIDIETVKDPRDSQELDMVKFSTCNT